MATRGQHVGGVRDAIVEDEYGSAARSQARALAALARPQKARLRNDHQLGNGDPCRRNPEHGKMFVLSSGTQWCPDQSHDMQRTERAALPDIDIGGLE